MIKRCVIGMGNPLLCDDMVGLMVATQARERFADQSDPGTSFAENTSGGFDLMYDLDGFDEAMIIDSIASGSCEPGTLVDMTLDDISFTAQPRLIDSHGLNLATVIAAGKKCGMKMPDHITILGIEGRDFQTFSDAPTRAVFEAIPAAVVRVGKFLCINEQTVDRAALHLEKESS